MQLFTPHEAAQMANIPAHSVRRWLVYHAAHLSANANPATGQPRRLTAKDVEVLRHVKALRSQGLSVAAINDALAKLTFAEIDTEPSTDDSPASPPVAHESQHNDLAPMPVVAVLQSVVGPLVERVEALERQRQRVDVVFIAVAAFVAGLIVGLAVWWFQ